MSRLSNYDVVFIDVVDVLFDNINNTKSYKIIEVGAEDTKTKAITNYGAINCKHNMADAVDTISEATIGTCAIGPTILRLEEAAHNWDIKHYTWLETYILKHLSPPEKSQWRHLARLMDVPVKPTTRPITGANSPLYFSTTKRYDNGQLKKPTNWPPR